MMPIDANSAVVGFGGIPAIGADGAIVVVADGCGNGAAATKFGNAVGGGTDDSKLPRLPGLYIGMVDTPVAGVTVRYKN